MSTAYVYDGSLEGLLTCVFEAYARHEHPDDIVGENAFQPRLGQEVSFVDSDREKACRVRDGIVRVCGKRTYAAVCAVYLSDDISKGRAVLDFVRYAMIRGKSALDDTVHERVAVFASLNKAVYNERHRWQQFMRFEEVEGGVYFARCNPSANVVPLLMGWFSARFNTQPFMIYDEVHDIVGISRDGTWSLVKTDELHVPSATLKERSMAKAWKTFYDAVSIESRCNHDLRRQFMPKRLWRNITEMKEEAEMAPSKDASLCDVSVISGSPCSSAPHRPKSCG